MALRDLDPNYFDILKCFHSHGVRYLLLGGYAVIHHGYDRTTNDFDLWIAVDPENAQRVSAALVDFGFSPEHVPASGFARAGTMFRMGPPGTRIEILTQPSGIDFETCWAARIETEIQGLPLNVISLQHLRQNKQASGRPKDLADLAELPPG